MRLDKSTHLVFRSGPLRFILPYNIFHWLAPLSGLRPWNGDTFSTVGRRWRQRRRLYINQYPPHQANTQLEITVLRNGCVCEWMRTEETERLCWRDRDRRNAKSYLIFVKLNAMFRTVRGDELLVPLRWFRELSIDDELFRLNAGAFTRRPHYTEPHRPSALNPLKDRFRNN